MADHPQPEHRRNEREQVTMPVSLVLRSQDRQATYEASTIDLSLGGASIQTYLELVPGEWVGVMPKTQFPYAIPSRVVWVRPQDAAGLFYQAGLKFLDTRAV